MPSLEYKCRLMEEVNGKGRIIVQKTYWHVKINTLFMKYFLSEFFIAIIVENIEN